VRDFSLHPTVGGGSRQWEEVQDLADFDKRCSRVGQNFAPAVLLDWFSVSRYGRARC
jgi:hypothetical protein